MSADYVDKTIEAYDNAPDKFASVTGDMTNHPELEIMLKYLPGKNSPILDVGCGYGRDSQTLTNMGYKTVGIDMSAKLLEKAQTAHPDLVFRKMDVRSLDFEDETFGAAWCNAVLLHLNDQDIQKALKEIKRVLKPDGVIAVSFKEGEGSKKVVESFTTDLARFYTFKTPESLNKSLEEAEFIVKESHTLNEQERFGPHKRDLTWVWSFATKPSRV